MFTISFKVKKGNCTCGRVIGVSLDIHNIDGSTPLHCAALSNQVVPLHSLFAFGSHAGCIRQVLPVPLDYPVLLHQNRLGSIGIG